MDLASTLAKLSGGGDDQSSSSGTGQPDDIDYDRYIRIGADGKPMFDREALQNDIRNGTVAKRCVVECLSKIRQYFSAPPDPPTIATDGASTLSTAPVNERAVIILMEVLQKMDDGRRTQVIQMLRQLANG